MRFNQGMIWRAIAAPCLAVLAIPVMAQSLAPTAALPADTAASSIIGPDGRRLTVPARLTMCATGGVLYTCGSSSNITTAQTTVGTTATLVAAARPGRQKVTITIGAANSCAIGPAGVTLTNGFVLQAVAGASLALDTSAAVYAVCSGTTAVSDIEQY